MIYLDNGATSFPKAPGMIKTMADCMERYCGNPGRSGHGMSVKTAEGVYMARKSLAEIFNIKEAERVVFCQNTTMALNMGIKGVLYEGDHAVTTAMEHNSVLRPLAALGDVGVSHDIVDCPKNGCVQVAAIKAAVRAETRLVVCTHASNVTGTIMPIAEIGEMIRRENQNRSIGRKILFMVDGAQSAGCVPIDVKKMQIDMLAVPGHKGLLGPLGTGALYVADGIRPYPLLEGGTGTVSRDRRQPTEMPEGMESGTVNAPGIIGLGHSLRWVQRTGVDNIRRHEEELIQPLHHALRNMAGVEVYGTETCKEKTAVVCFNIKGKSCEEVGTDLWDNYGIAVRGGYHCAGLAHKAIGTWDCGAVRASAGPFNTKKEISVAIDAVYKISKS